MRYTKYFKKEDVSRSEWDEIKRARERKRQITHSSLTKHPQHSQSEFLYSFPHNRVAQVRRRLFIFDFHSIVSRLYFLAWNFYHAVNGYTSLMEKKRRLFTHTHNSKRQAQNCQIALENFKLCHLNMMRTDFHF